MAKDMEKFFNGEDSPGVEENPEMSTEEAPSTVKKPTPVKKKAAVKHHKHSAKKTVTRHRR